MSADEVLDAADRPGARLDRTVHARQRDGEFHGFDLRETQPLHLIRKATSVKRTFKDESTEHSVTIELHDSQAALALLGKHHKLFTEKVEHTGADGGPIRTEVYDYSTAIAALAGRSDDDSDPSGEDAGAGDGPALGEIDDGRGD
jgi:hypothetical protein